MKKFLILILVFTILSPGCKEDEMEDTASVNVQIVPKIGNETLVLDQAYTDAGGLRIKVNFLKFYLSHLSLVSTDGSLAELKDIALFDYENPSVISAEVTDGEYSGIHFGLGLNPEQNNSDPDSFPASHPLSYAQAMHWDTWIKYKFLIIEGRVDEDTTGTDWTKAYSYHTGFDDVFREVEIARNLIIENGQNNIVINLDINKIFYGVNDTIDLLTENNVHGSSTELALAMRLSDLCKNAFE